MERIGVIGLGRMGSAIAGRLAGKGFAVTGWNRTPKAVPAGVATAPTVAGLIEASDIVVLSLFDDAAVREILEQVLALPLAGRLVADTSTVRPDTIAGFAARLEAAGAAAVDAPISGGPEMVAAGTAGVFVGGAKADVARFQPVAGVIAARVRHTGPLGAGNTAKIVNNMMLISYWEGLRAAMLVGRKGGLSAREVVSIVAEGPAGTGALKGRMAEILGESDRIGYPVAGIVKDARLFLGVAEDLGVDAPTIRAALSSFSDLAERGLADEDLAALIREAGREG